MSSRLTLLALLGLAMGALGACSPVVIDRGLSSDTPRFSEDAIVADDGARLPIRRWPAKGKTRAVILALHGFNDYSNFFADNAEGLAAFGITSYAYDQRGFGATADRGYWHGTESLVRDVDMAVALIRRREPGLPLYILGESMGGAVVIVAMTEPNAPKVNGVILSAPAVWGRETMPWYQRWALWTAARTVPWMTLTGRGLNIKPSDNYAMLLRMSKDPLVIKRTRVDAIEGLVDLMDLALARSSKLETPALVLYGDHDEIVPDRPTHIMIGRLPPEARDRQTIGFYQTGFHMLLHDLSAPTVERDIRAWITDPARPLPSGADRWAAIKLAEERAQAQARSSNARAEARQAATLALAKDPR